MDRNDIRYQKRQIAKESQKAYMKMRMAVQGFFWGKSTFFQKKTQAKEMARHTAQRERLNAHQAKSMGWVS